MPVILVRTGDNNTRQHSREKSKKGQSAFSSLSTWYSSLPTIKAMLGFSGTTTNTATGTSSNRVRRAQQLRQQRMAAAAANSSSSNQTLPKVQENTTTANNNKDDEIMVISGMWTIFAALFIVVLGAAMAVIFFISYKPECVQGIFLGEAKVYLTAEGIATKDASVTTGGQ